jgi:predicted lactoylglutathione lyase
MAQHGPVLEQVNLVVADVAASVAFYESIGVRFEPTSEEWAPHHRSAVSEDGLDFDLDSHEFATVWNNGWPGQAGRSGGSGPSVPGSGVIGFRLASRDEVDALHLSLVAAGSASQQAPYDTFWGSRYAVVEDPDGNAVGLMSPSDPERRQPPPAPGSWGSAGS